MGFPEASLGLPWSLQAGAALSLPAPAKKIPRPGIKARKALAPPSHLAAGSARRRGRRPSLNLRPPKAASKGGWRPAPWIQLAN